MKSHEKSCQVIHAKPCQVIRESLQVPIMSIIQQYDRPSDQPLDHQTWSGIELLRAAKNNRRYEIGSNCRPPNGGPFVPYRSPGYLMETIARCVVLAGSHKQ